MDEIDVYRTAKLLIDTHGPRLAWQRAAVRLAELAGDEAGQATWIRVIEAIDVLTATSPRGGSKLQ